LHLRSLVAASALLSAPTIVILLIRRLLARYMNLPLSRSGSAALLLIETAASLISAGALALLAADLRAGGTWGWRDSWSRVLGRARPIITGGLAGLLVTALTGGPIALFLICFILGGEPGTGPASLFPSLLALGVFCCFMFCASSLILLLTVVTAVEQTGGFRATRVTWQLLRKDLRRSVFTIGLAQSLIFVPNLALRLGHVRHPIAAALEGAGAVIVAPFVVLVVMSVYWEARDADGAGATRLRANLDAQ
jgi:hypothetical protein